LNEKPNILIVDDEMLIGMALADDLMALGYAISGPFATTADADASCKIDKPDMAFLDVNLGKDRTSHDFARKLLKKKVPVVFLTGYSELFAANAEFDDIPVLSKPVELEKVIRSIKYHLEGTNSSD
jgi:two-component SAPR family response regulator